MKPSVLHFVLVFLQEKVSKLKWYAAVDDLKGLGYKRIVGATTRGKCPKQRKPVISVK